MRISTTVATIFGFLAGMIFTGIAANLSAGRMMLRELKSPYDYEKTMDTVTARINAAPGWHVVAVYDMNKEVQEHGGLPIGKYGLIKYCSGSYASEMLRSDDRKRIGAMMPKAFAVYEKSDGRVYVATANGAVMGKMFGGETEDIIERVSLEVEEMLRFLNFKSGIF